MIKYIAVTILIFNFLLFGSAFNQEQIREIRKDRIEPRPEMIHEMGHPFEVLMQIKGMIECNAYWKESIGLGKIGVVEFRDGSQTSVVQKVPSGFKTETIQILIDLRHARPVFDWFKRWARGKGTKKDVRIILINPHSQEKYHINLKQTWPSQLKVVLHPPHQPRLLIFLEADNVLI
jgi:hypothetical protein